MSSSILIFSSNIKLWGSELVFNKQNMILTYREEPRLQAWLDKQFHGEMAWMEKYGMTEPDLMNWFGTLRVIGVNELSPTDAAFQWTLNNPMKLYQPLCAWSGLSQNKDNVLKNSAKEFHNIVSNSNIKGESTFVLSLIPHLLWRDH